MARALCCLPSVPGGAETMIELTAAQLSCLLWSIGMAGAFLGLFLWLRIDKKDEL